MILRPFIATPLSAFLLVGCTGGPPAAFDFWAGDETPEARAERCDDGVGAEEGVKLQMIRQLMEGGKLHAALANLDASDQSSPEDVHLRAELLRQTGRPGEAEPLYRSLLEGCRAGRGHHGLGLIAGRERRLDEALKQLEEARRLLPTDAHIRNDLGYAFLLRGDDDRARHEFVTALELEPNHGLSASNLVLLLLVRGEDKSAESLAKQSHIDAPELTALRAQAHEIRPGGGAPWIPPAASAEGERNTGTPTTPGARPATASRATPARHRQASRHATKRGRVAEEKRGKRRTSPAVDKGSRRDRHDQV